ncbi:TPA_asm: hypothetical protein [ssRNA phage Gephyllon.1_2]|uniref:Uncharacterized protein n=2 Tax=Norzivirales TaxID=2842247 RepID=A0A8S5L235_9VIRU|nr:hypothetical protein QIJ14_gp5 [ssRNA phage Gephyllon.1_2]QDH90426.1 MAG: hypothetical protein H1BulkLitter4157_000001 [Leviviridae sp.]DAD51902.1 TPA_asm: hypothetical protein [ssRNA phage Gephyllon.1_2]
MSIEIVDRPTFYMDAQSFSRPYGGEKGTHGGRLVVVRPETVIQDMETVLGLKVCEFDARSVVLHIILRKMDGEAQRISFRAGSYRRLDWGDGKSTAAEVAEDLLKAYGYRIKAFWPRKGYYTIYVPSRD